MAVVISFVGKFDGKDLERAQREMAKLGKTAAAQDSSVKSSFKSMAAGAIGLGAAFGVGFAGLQAVGNAVRDAFAEAQESIKTTAATAQIIKSTGGAAKVTADQVGELANRISEIIGVDDELVQSSANLILTFKNVRNEGDGLNAVFDRSVMAAQDLAAAGFGDAASAAKMLGKALNDPERGLTALSRAGVTFTQQQKDQIAALMESGNVLAAQKIILGEVESQVGGVAAATATSADKFQVLYRNTLEALGLAIMPLANALMSALIPALRGMATAIGSVSTFIRDNADGLRIAAVAVAALTASILIQRGVLTASAIAFGIQTVAVNAYVAAALIARGASEALTMAMRAIPFVAIATAVALFIQKLNEGADAQRKWREEAERTKGVTWQLRDANGELTDKAIAYAAANRFARQTQRDTRDAISGTVSAALSYGKTLPTITDMTEGLGDAASRAAGGVLSLMTAAVEAGRMWREARSMSGTVTSALYEGLASGADLTAARLKEIRENLEKASKVGSGGKGSKRKDKTPEKQAAEDLALLDDSAKRALQSVNEMAMGYDDLTRSLGADDIASFSRSMLAAGQITETTKGEFESLVGVIRDRLNQALTDAKDRLRNLQQQYDDLFNRVQQGISQGNGIADAAQQQADAAKKLADAQKEYQDAVKGGNAEDIDKTASALESAKKEQGTFLTFLQKGVDSAEAFSGQIQQLIKANASLDVVSQIVQMGAKAGSRIAAELLDGGAEAINQANRMVNAVQVAAATAGTLAASTFYGAGVASAQAYVTALETTVQPLLQSLLNRIAAEIASALRQPVNPNLGSGPATNPTTAAIASPFSAALAAYAPLRPGAGPNIPSGEGRIYAELMALSRRADGGPVSSSTPYLVGEVGPELFIPGRGGTIIPNDQLTGRAGNTYNITVQAGIGDPREIGRAAVEAIRAFERSSAPVFAAA